MKIIRKTNQIDLMTFQLFVIIELSIGANSANKLKQEVSHDEFILWLGSRIDDLIAKGEQIPLDSEADEPQNVFSMKYYIEAVVDQTLAGGKAKAHMYIGQIAYEAWQSATQ